MGGGKGAAAGDRSLVADRNWLVDRRELRRPWPREGEAWLGDQAGARLRSARAVARWRARQTGRNRCALREAAAAAGLIADPLAGGGALREGLSQRLSRLLSHRRC